MTCYPFERILKRDQLELPAVGQRVRVTLSKILIKSSELVAFLQRETDFKIS
jgi:hypothetical protein